MLPTLILAMGHRATNSMSVCLSVSLFCGLPVFTSWRPVVCVHWNRARPLGCTREGPKRGTASPKLECEEESPGPEAGDVKFRPNWVRLVATSQFPLQGLNFPIYKMCRWGCNRGFQMSKKKAGLL